MNYKVMFKGRANGEKVEERLIDAATITIDGGMTRLLSAGLAAFPLLIIPNDRIISIEKIG